MTVEEQKLVSALQAHKSGKLQEAESLYQQILQHNRNNDTALYYYAILCHQSGNIDKAINLLEDAVQISSQADYFKSLAEMYLSKNMKAEAVNCYQRGLQVAPNDAGLLYNIGMLLFRENQFNDAANCFKAAQQLEPNNVEYNYVLALALHNLGALDDAYNCYKRVIELQPNNGEAYNNIGIIYYHKHDVYKAVESFEKALSLGINRLEVYANLSNLYVDTAEPQKAINMSLQGLKLNPNNASLIFNLARAQFLSGDIDNGWEYFKYRRLINERKGLKTFLLDYNGSLEGKTVYVYRDTGYGDTIQFIRYLTLLHQKGAKVLCAPQTELADLIKNSDLEAEIVPESAQPETLNYDFQINLTSLAYPFKCDINNFPYKDRYLSASQAKIDEYKTKYFNNDKFKLGIVWQGSNVTASQMLNSVDNVSTFFPFAKLPEVQVYSLMKGQAMAQLDNLPGDINIINLGATFKDFSDSAAAIENLDLLIVADTAYSHLAGALGKQAWVFIPYVPNWRWFMDRTDSPWYSSLRLFRQQKQENWDNVIQRIYLEFTEFLKNNCKKA